MLPPGTLAAAGGPLGVLSGGLAGRAELAVDPNEPLYCSCQRVSFGDMVACEADTCPIEWFHYECVGASELLRSVLPASAPSLTLGPRCRAAGGAGAKGEMVLPWLRCAATGQAREARGQVNRSGQ